MSLSSIAFSSYQNTIANAYTRPATVASARVASVTSITAVSPRSNGQTSVASGLGDLLTTLAAGDVSGSQASLGALAQTLRSTQAAADDHVGAGLTRVLARVSATLDQGETTPALAQIQNFLLDSGRSTGTGFNATV